MKKNYTFHKRKVWIVFFLCLLMILCLIGRLIYLMGFRSDYYYEKAEDLHERERDIKAARGEIVDAKGKVLAANKTVCTISVIHSQIKEPEKVIALLTEKLGISEQTVRKKVEKISSIERIRTNVEKETGDEIRNAGFAGIKVDEDYINEISENQPVSYYLSQALQNRKDLQALDYQRKAANLGTKAAKAENLPSLAITGGYVAADIPGFVTITNAINIGLGVSYNLDNLWKKNSSLLKSQAREKQLEANNELLNDHIKLELNKDFQNYNLAKKKIEVYERALEQATENYRITKNKYDNGLANITDLLEADAALVGAKVNVINSRADAALAYKKLLQTSGILNQ